MSARHTSATTGASTPSPRWSWLGFAVLALAATAACGDSTAPAAGSRLRLTVEPTAGDTSALLGVALSARLSDSTGLRELRVYVDSARQPVPVASEFRAYGAEALGVVAFLPGPGRHTVTAAVTDTLGRVFSASFARDVTLAETPYTATALPDLGGAANALHVNAAGDVAGWVAVAGGRPQPALWRGGVLAVLPVPDGLVGATARRVNSAGDVLLSAVPDTANTASTGLVVRRPDGAVVPIGPFRTTIVSGGREYTFIRCCAVGDLNDQRQAIGGPAATPIEAPFPLVSARYDVAAARLLDTLSTVNTAPVGYALLNNRGQLAGQATTGVGYPSTYTVTQGFELPPLPDGAAATACDPYAGRWTSTQPVALDDAANLLVNARCGSFALLSAGGSTWLDRYVGRSVAARLSPQGGVVAALDSAGVVRVWNAATRRAATVRLAGGAWRVDSLGWVNAGGVIAAHGVNTATGRAGALLLVPAAP